MNCFKHLMLTPLAALAVLGCCDTLYAQPQLIVTPASVTNSSTPLTFTNVPTGGISAAQTITVCPGSACPGNGTMASVSIQINQSSPWITVGPSQSVNIPSTLSVQCNTTNLASGTYNGSFTISDSAAPSDSVTVYVSLTVTGSSLLYASPTSLTFSAQEGASTATPNGTSVQILSSGSPLSYNLQAQTVNGGNWLLLSTTTGSTSGQPFTVSVNPSALTASSFPAIFNGNITATSTTLGATNNSVIIPVQLTLNSTAQLSVTPTNPPPFLYQAGTTADPASQQLAISSSGGSQAFTIQENPSVAWLVLSALGGTAGSTADIITMNATPVENGMGVGTYTTNLIITPSGQAALPPVPVTLVVAAHPLIQLSTNTLTFSGSFAGAQPPIQSVNLSTSGGALVPFSVTSNASWLVVNALSNTAPTMLNVQANTSGLTAQSYTGTITISPTNGDTYTETITVSLSINAASQLVAGPQNLLFSYETGQALPQPQDVEIMTTGQPLSFAVTAGSSNCGNSWLAASQNTPSGQATSNTTLTVSVVPTGIAAGTSCTGSVVLAYNSGLAPTSLSIPVTLNVTSGAQLSVNVMPGFGLVTLSQTSPPVEQQISLTSTDSTTQVSFSAAVIDASGPWLGLSGSTNGTTPENLFLEYIPSAVTTPGTYTGTVQINSGSLPSSTYSIPVTLTVTSNTTVTVSPTSLTFTEPQGGSAPAAQTLTLTSSPNTATYTASISYSQGSNWLQISPTSGNANGPIQVTVQPNTLSQGSYMAQISFVYQGAATTTATVNVVLNVTASQSVAASPSSLSFAYQAGGTQPASQQLSITSTVGPVTVAVSTSSSGWLSVSSTGGATPQTINVSVNPSGLAVQAYNGSISISAPGVLATPISIPVTLTVSAAPPPAPTLILNNATGTAGAIAPGEEIAIKGSNLGPSTPAAGTLFSLNSAGGVSNTLAGVQVLFDNIPGTPIFVSANQIDVSVPYEINGRQSTTMVVMYNGVASAPFQLTVAAAAPGLFTDNSSGQGQVAATNQDHSVNGATGSGFEPAPRGTVIALYATGGGQTTPVSTTGSVTPIPTNASGLLNIPNVTATIGGLPATVQFAGEAPGFVTGVNQINVTIPEGVTPGPAVPVTITIGNVTSPAGTTIAVQ
jgi:trimeric autotransporter adhesin